MPELETNFSGRKTAGVSAARAHEWTEKILFEILEKNQLQQIINVETMQQKGKTVKFLKIVKHDLWFCSV